MTTGTIPAGAGATLHDLGFYRDVPPFSFGWRERRAERIKPSKSTTSRDLAAFGPTRPQDGQALEIVFVEDTTGYAKVVLRRDTGDLPGRILAGDTDFQIALRSFIGRQPPADLE